MSLVGALRAQPRMRNSSPLIRKVSPMTTRRNFLRGAAIGGLALGSVSVFEAMPVQAAEMPVKRIQNGLNGLGYSAGTVDGKLNSATVAAVKRFQTDHKLSVDGKPGAVTQSVLAAMVSLVQYKAGATRDSSYGATTSSKVKSYQSSNGLTADGKAGPATMSKMGLTRVVGSGKSSVGGSIKRTEVIQRAAYWPTLKLGYSRKTYHRDLNNSKTYRQDCSGQVSNAFHATTSYSTRTLSQIAGTISKGSLLPGDILNSYDYHTVVFCGWANAAQTAYYSFEESGSKGAVGREVSPYPFFGEGKNWTPRRYSHIAWG